MLRNYFKTAFRTLSRNLSYSFINIAGLSLGLASTMLIMLYVKDEWSFDRFHQKGDRLYRVGRDLMNADGSRLHSDGYSGYMQGPAFKSAIPEVVDFVRVANNRRDVKLGNTISSQSVFYADPGFFSMFSFPLLSGDPKTVLKEPSDVVITEDIARKYFGTENPIGKIVSIKNDGRFEPHAITGVARNCPQNSSIQFQILLPLTIAKEDLATYDAWLNSFLYTYLLVKPGSRVSDLESKMKGALSGVQKEISKFALEKYGTKWTTTYRLQPVAQMHLSEEYPVYEGNVSSKPLYSYILSAVAILMLMIACINFVNLTIARSAKRAKEIGIRKVIGGDRRQLIFQFLGESVILCAMAFLLALAMAQALLPVFNRLSNKALSLSYLLDVKLVAAYIILFLATSFLAGFYPALVLSGYRPVQILYNRFIVSGKGNLQKSLVVFQFSLASFLIMATIIMYSQFNHLTKEKLGYEDKNLVVVEKRDLNPREVNLFREELKPDPNILEVAARNNGRRNTSVKIEGREIFLVCETVSESYLAALQVKPLRGRNFSKEIPSDSSSSVLVNESFVRESGWKDAVGKQIEFGYDHRSYQVIGVVPDYHFLPLQEKILPQLLVLGEGDQFGRLLVKIKDGSATNSLSHIDRAFRKLFPLSPLNYHFKDEENLMNYESESKWKQMIFFAALFTIFISSIGLFGLSVLSAEKRTREIGIRKVLGASVSGIVGILSKDFLKLVMLGLVFAMPLAWFAANKWLENYPYRIQLSWWMFALAGIFVSLIAFVTVSFQSFSAARANPSKSLRSE